MKCPVCKTELDATVIKCPACGFDDLYHEFISAEDATDWVDNVVNPYRLQWENKKQASPQDIFKSLLSEQMNLIPGTPQKSKKKRNSIFEFEICDDGIKITKCKKKSERIVVPDNIEGYPVTRIGATAFKELSDVNEIVLPRTISTIEEYAFYNCDVKHVTIPDACEQIGKDAFSCANIREIVFPSSIQVISDSICSTCFLLNTVVIMGAKVIEQNAFALCGGLKNIAFGGSVDSIERGAFMSCGFERIILPKSLGKIKMDAFTHCNAAIAFLDDNSILERNCSPDWISNNTIYCNDGSTAQIFARENNITCKPLRDFPRD